MENKYYTPEIEEFHVGFECQMKDIPPPEDDWKDETISIFHKLEDLQKWLDKGEIRVKYLDREDLEYLGFKLFQFPDDFDFEFQISIEGVASGKVTLTDEGLVEDIEINGHSFFDFAIRNKSELRRVMKMLNIE
ncbi:MAG TPA: hypothetical protein VEA37_02875 [Flavobacterium sp.]|nr:hypothetical protein [Flavobacterium sp.]